MDVWRSNHGVGHSSKIQINGFIFSCCCTAYMATYEKITARELLRIGNCATYTVRSRIIYINYWWFCIGREVEKQEKGRGWVKR